MLDLPAYERGWRIMRRDHPRALQRALRHWSIAVLVSSAMTAFAVLGQVHATAIFFGLLGIAALMPMRAAVSMLAHPEESLLTAMTVFFPLWGSVLAWLVGVVFLSPIFVPVLATAFWGLFLSLVLGNWAATRIVAVCSICSTAAIFAGMYMFGLVGAAAVAWHLVMTPALLLEVGRKLAVAEVGSYSCPLCGYDLRGLASGAVCPECGGVPSARGAASERTAGTD